MRFTVFVPFLLIYSLSCLAQFDKTRKDSFPNYGNEIKNSAFFRDRYQYNDLTHYLDNLNDYVTYQSETTGQFDVPEMMIFSISGNSHKWNKYYLNGFRLDNRFTPGSTLFKPDLFTHSLKLDYLHSAISFKSDSIIPNSASVKYNFGGLGGISAGTEELIHLFHYTASERLFKPVEFRNKMKGAGEVIINYAIPSDGKLYNQQFTADFGTRMLVNFDETGISNYYPEDFFRAQLAGEFAFETGKLFDNTNYILNFLQRDNLYNEFYYGQNETARNTTYSFSVYGSKKTFNTDLTTGFTISNTNVIHNDLNFSRNLIDQDGEAFEPWYPNGNTSEISYSLNFNKNLSKNIQLNFVGYNSIINFATHENTFQNSVYARNVNLPFRSLYVYNWTSNEFTSVLLENTLGLQANKKLSGKLDFKSNLDLTFDGMIMSEKSMIRANWQLQAGLYYHPSKWFSMELTLNRNRVSFNFDDIRYFSNDYLNGEIYYWQDINNDQQFQENEKSDFFTSTGGKYHTAIKNLKQPTVFTIDLPFYFRFGNHEISVMNTYSKYNNFWNTAFANEASENGYFQTVGNQEIFFMNNGIKQYEVGYYDTSIMKTDGFFNFMTNSPFYVSNLLKYQFRNEKFMFSLSWWSGAMAGMSTLGNGPLHNNIGVYSETSANPNIKYKLLGRYDQERAYVCRLLFSYIVNKNFSFALTGKFKDGQPFTNFATHTIKENSGNNQMAIWALRTKGINPFTGDFGSREDACFNIDLNVTCKGMILKNNFEIKAMIYNLYDFGTELTEYTFEPTEYESRNAMSLNIPRGLMITTKIFF